MSEGWVTVMSPCVECGQLFSYHPHHVPSIRVRRALPGEQGNRQGWIADPEGHREPICESCVAIANPIREANGLPPVAVRPDAYEGCPESELDG